MKIENIFTWWGKAAFIIVLFAVTAVLFRNQFDWTPSLRRAVIAAFAVLIFCNALLYSRNEAIEELKKWRRFCLIFVSLFAITIIFSWIYLFMQASNDGWLDEKNAPSLFLLINITTDAIFLFIAVEYVDVIQTVLQKIVKRNLKGSYMR